MRTVSPLSPKECVPRVAATSQRQSEQTTPPLNKSSPSHPHSAAINLSSNRCSQYYTLLMAYSGLSGKDTPHHSHHSASQAAAAAVGAAGALCPKPSRLNPTIPSSTPHIIQPHLYFAAGAGLSLRTISSLSLADLPVRAHTQTLLLLQLLPDWVNTYW